MLPEGFVFSQSSLQDYVDCARRFQLRYLEGCRWPAPETTDALELEQLMQKGHALHRLLRQLYSGVPLAILEGLARSDPTLDRWLTNYRTSAPENLPDVVREAELTLSTALSLQDPAHISCRIEARYDLVAGKPGERWVIVDWKTGNRRQSRSWLAERLQTRVYPFVLVRAGAVLNDGLPIAPSQVEMVYWFAEFPVQPERLVYDDQRFAADAAYLDRLVNEIAERTRAPDAFPRTEERRLCRYCVYRSLCWDDVQAALLSDAVDAEWMEPAAEEIDLESIVPIPF